MLITSNQSFLCFCILLSNHKIFFTFFANIFQGLFFLLEVTFLQFMHYDTCSDISQTVSHSLFLSTLAYCILIIVSFKIPWLWHLFSSNLHRRVSPTESVALKNLLQHWSVPERSPTLLLIQPECAYLVTSDRITVHGGTTAWVHKRL